MLVEDWKVVWILVAKTDEEGRDSLLERD